MKPIKKTLDCKKFQFFLLIDSAMVIQPWAKIIDIKGKIGAIQRPSLFGLSEIKNHPLIKHQINQGQAVYMPGASCVIKATADIDLQKFRDLAAACSMKHMEFLESIKVEEK